jgi:hypothetical protein
MTLPMISNTFVKNKPCLSTVRGVGQKLMFDPKLETTDLQTWCCWRIPRNLRLRVLGCAGRFAEEVGPSGSSEGGGCGHRRGCGWGYQQGMASAGFPFCVFDSEWSRHCHQSVRVRLEYRLLRYAFHQVLNLVQNTLLCSVSKTYTIWLWSLFLCLNLLWSFNNVHVLALVPGDSAW